MIDTARLIVGAVVLAVVLALGIAGYQHVKGIGAAEVRAELQPKIDTLTTERDAAQAQLTEAERDRQKAEEASSVYQTELASLRAAPVRRDPVRLCVEPAPAARPLAASAAAGSGGTAAPAGMVLGGTGADLVPGPDIGPELRELVRRADEVSGQARGLQAYCTDEARP